MKKIIPLLILVVFVILFIGSSNSYIQVNDQKIAVSIADSNIERIKGLSGIEEQSMLFIFEKEDFYGIWMKDMLFSIDIVWINSEKEIIYIERNVSPDTYPEVFTPPVVAKYVLETPVNLLNLKLGDIVDL